MELDSSKLFYHNQDYLNCLPHEMHYDGNYSDSGSSDEFDDDDDEPNDDYDDYDSSEEDSRKKKQRIK